MIKFEVPTLKKKSSLPNECANEQDHEQKIGRNKKIN